MISLLVKAHLMLLFLQIIVGSSGLPPKNLFYQLEVMTLVLL